MKKYKWNILISSLLILLPGILGGVFWDQFRFPAGGKLMFVLWMPLIFLAAQFFCLWITLKDPKNKAQSPKIVNLVLWLLPGISCFIGGITYLIANGLTSNIGGYSVLLLGVMFAVIGNFMPKCKQNSTMGIKVKWTLQDEENWNATHRFGGKVWVIGGIAMMGLVFLPEGAMMAGMLVGIFGLALVPTLYSYLYYKKQIEAGTDNIQPIITPKNQKTALIVLAVMLPLIMIGCLVLSFTGKVEVSCEETAISIKATYWADMTIAYEDIEAAEIRENVPGSRVYGFGSPRLQLGSFENGEFGLYTRYTQGADKTCIVLWIQEEIVVFSGENDIQTREIYDILIQKGVAK